MTTTKKAAELRNTKGSPTPEFKKAEFVEKIRELMTVRRLSVGELAANMGQRSPAPIYRLLGGQGSIGPRLVAGLASALDADAVLSAYAAWMPGEAPRVRQLLETGSGHLSMVPKSIVTWLEIDEIERALKGDTKSEATIVSLGEPAAAIDRRVLDIVCGNVADGGRYRYITPLEEPWIETFGQTLRDRLKTYPAVTGEIVCVVDRSLASWSLVSTPMPVLELLTFEDDRSPQAFLLVSNEILKYGDDRFAVRLNDRVAVKIERDARLAERGKGVSKWQEMFRINK